MTVIDILNKIKELLQTKDWCNKAFCRDASGKSMGNDVRNILAASYSLEGALMLVCQDSFVQSKILHLFEIDVCDTICFWEDKKGRTKIEVIALIDRAIEMSQWDDNKLLIFENRSERLQIIKSLLEKRLEYDVNSWNHNSAEEVIDIEIQILTINQKLLSDKDELKINQILLDTVNNYANSFKKLLEAQKEYDLHRSKYVKLRSSIRSVIGESN